MPSVRAFKRHCEDDPLILVCAYLHDPMPIDGPKSLLDQKHVVDGLAARAGHPIVRYVVDSGSALTKQGRGARLQAMLDEPRHPGRRVLLIIASPRHLAVTPDGVTIALADLLTAGVALKDASGELHPSAATASVASKTARRAPVAKSPNRRNRDRTDA